MKTMSKKDLMSYDYKNWRESVEKRVQYEVELNKKFDWGIPGFSRLDMVFDFQEKENRVVDLLNQLKTLEEQRKFVTGHIRTYDNILRTTKDKRIQKFANKQLVKETEAREKIIFKKYCVVKLLDDTMLNFAIDLMGDLKYYEEKTKVNNDE